MHRPWDRSWDRPAGIRLSRHAGARWLAGLALATAGGLIAPAHAQTAPDAAPAGAAGGGGATVQTGGLRDQIAGAFAATNPRPPANPLTPAWLITPSLTVQEEWTDNATQGTGTGTGKQASFITVVIPSLSIAGETSRLKADLTYAPSLYAYSNASGQNRVGQNLNANGLLTVLPDTLFLDVRGFAAEQALAGATAPAGTTALSKQNTVQSYSFSASPYATHRFGGWGTAEVGVSFNETTQGALAGAVPGGGTATQTLLSRQEFASFSSGENFGRWLSNVRLSAVQDSGQGALQGAYRNLATYQAGYAFNHAITGLASIGWEDIFYGGAGVPRVNDATWSIGAKLTPNPDSSLTVLYGHQDGIDAPVVDGSYALTPRIRLYAHYAKSVSTDAEQLQNSLANATLDPLGHPLDAQTGAPLLLTDNFFGVSGAVYRLENASLTAAWLLDRDAVQVSLTRQVRTPIGNVAGGAFTTFGGLTITTGNATDRGTYGSIAWQHQIRTDLSTNLFFQYGTDVSTTPLTATLGNQSGSGTQQQTTRLVAASAAVTYRLSETLTGSLQYSYTSDSFSGGLPGVSANLIVASLHKTF